MNNRTITPGRIIDPVKSVARKNPTLAKQWHKERNFPKTPWDFSAGSKQKAWWLCPNGHEWQAVIQSRNRGIGCPLCRGTTSQLELQIYAYLRKTFPSAELRSRKLGVECDILVPELKLAIEIDGGYWHQNKRLHDMRKNRRVKSAGYRLLRIREAGLAPINAWTMRFEKGQPSAALVARILEGISQRLRFNKKTRDLLKHNARTAHDEYLKLRNRFPGPLPGRSLGDFSRKIAAEWDRERNHPLTPKTVSFGSSHIVWWRCRPAGHSWRSTVSTRTSMRTSCPFCQNRAVGMNNSLAGKFPNIAKEWHPTKNRPKTPSDFAPRSGVRIWWRCLKDSAHPAWITDIKNRTRGSGCPSCKGKRPTAASNLLKAFPQIAEELHRQRNATLEAISLLPYSNRRVWWQCGECRFEWQTKVVNRTANQSGCPECRRKRR